MEPAINDERLTKVETDVALMSQQVRGLENSVASMLSEQREFRAEWQRTKAAEAQAEAQQARSGKLTMPQIVAMGASVAAVTGLMLGGLMWMITNVASTVRSDATAQIGQLGLQVKSASDNIANTQVAVSVLQRDLATDRVKLGLVEQVSSQTARFVEGMQSFDAQFARQDEQIKALQQVIRDIAARQAAPPRVER